MARCKWNYHCPIYKSKTRTWTRWPTTGPTSFSMLSAGNQTHQGIRMQGSPSGPALEKPALVFRAVAAVHSIPVAHSTEVGSPLSGSASSSNRREPASLPECVLNTISQTRTLSTRHLFSLQWSVFSSWCLAHGQMNGRLAGAFCEPYLPGVRAW